MTFASRFLGLAVAASLAGCAMDMGGSGSDEELPDFEDYVGGKGDTGYIGNRAAELEATLRGRVRVAVPNQTSEQLAALAAELAANPTAWEHRDLTDQVDEQIKYARNALKAQKLNLNLEGGSPAFDSVTVVEGGLEISYTLSVESLVKMKDLESQGLQAGDLVGRTISARLPLSPANLFERVGASCATDPDTGNAPDAHDLGAHNMFYYWDPARPGCQLGEGDLATAEYRVDSSVDSPNVYPEYDQLVADGRIDMSVIFGQIEHGELKSNDWGFTSFNDLTRAFSGKGFRIVERFPENRGHRLEKTMGGGLVVSIRMYTPVGFADNVPSADSSERFRSAIRESEIFYYNGHAFYGSLSVLDDPSAYPEGRYQILFMDACWSYAYYTKQIFRNRVSATDLDGYGQTDVVNNTEPGITGSELTAAILYENIFKGAEAVRLRRDASLYSWNNLTKYMNDHAELRARRRSTHPDPEIYGASGVRTNRYRPGAITPPPPPPPPAARRFETTAAVEIPDNAPSGAASTLQVPAGSGVLGVVTVEAAIEHTYIGDLTVTVTHAGKTVSLHNKTGGGTDNLTLRVPSAAFRGLTADGDWTLRVVDTASQDTGRVVRFAVSL